MTGLASEKQLELLPFYHKNRSSLSSGVLAAAAIGSSGGSSSGRRRSNAASTASSHDPDQDGSAAVGCEKEREERSS
ncbi:hypothetical protein QYF36_017355 [Acer negundo]|nr:hypothetical protein QYF36_017355 [Acer negundo]